MKQHLSSPSRANNTAQYKKIFCAYHPTQFLTNFCLQKQCLMPLCPSCVVQHTEQHYEAKQKPTYVNLNDALAYVKDKCYQQVNQLQQYYRVNEQIMNYIDGLKLYIKKQLSICKETIFDHITVLFDQYQSILFKQITQKYRQAEVYDFHQSAQVKASILQNIQSLYQKTSQIKSDQCLSALIKYHGQDQQIIDSNLQVIKQYLQKNKNAGGIHIGLDEDILVQSFKDLCLKVVSLKTVTQKDLIQQASTNKNRKQSQGSKKPITISSRLRSPSGPLKKKDPKKQTYQSPFKQKYYKGQRQSKTGRPGVQYYNTGL